MAAQAQIRLSEAELDELWQHYTAHRDPRTREQLARAYLRLVKYVLHRIMAGHDGSSRVLEADDLYTAGVTGLLAAIDAFDPSRGFKFVTLAVPRIRGAILDELRNMDWFSRGLRKQVNALYRAYRELELELGRIPSDEELAARLEVDARQLDALMQAASRCAVLSLDEEVHFADEGAGRLGDTIADPTAADARGALQRQQAVALVEDAIRSLPEKERLVITLYYFKEMTLKEIGDVLGVTESRACQLHGQATVRLKARLSALRTDLADLL